MTMLYKENTKTRDTYNWMLILHVSFLRGSKIATNDPIYLMQTINPTNPNPPVHLKWFMKGSEACKYLEIGPNFDLREHYYLNLWIAYEVFYPGKAYVAIKCKDVGRYSTCRKYALSMGTLVW